MSNFWRSLSHTLAALTANCGEFGDCWEKAAATERWQGEWRSEVNGHRGALRCVLRQSGPAVFEAWFHARYARWLRVCYHATLQATPSPDGWRLEGGTDLGALAGGVYTYEGELTRSGLRCVYACRYDRGTFDLTPVN